MKNQVLKACFLLLFTSGVFAQTSWFIQNSGTTRDLFSVNFVNTNTGWAAGGNGGYVDMGIIIKTTNSGTNWFTLPYSDTTYLIISIQFLDQSTGYAAGYDVNSHGIIIKTLNGGTSWQTVFNDTTKIKSMSFINSNTGWLCGTKNRIAKTTNGGLSWIFQQSNLSIAFDLYNISFFDGNTGCCAGDYGTLLWTTNAGMNWVNTPQNVGNYFRAISYQNSGTCFAVGTFRTYSPTGRGIVFKTSDSGINWSNIFTYVPPHTFDMAGFATIQFIDASTGWTGGTSGTAGVMQKTTNGGVSWSEVNTNTTNDIEQIFFVNSMTGWAVERNGTIIKTTTGGGPIGLEPISTNIPQKFNLSQNYPNPFNPSTTIKFDVPPSISMGMIRLTLYDVLGHEVASLVNQQLQPGSYSIDWDAANYPSGVYFYSLVVDNTNNGGSGDYKETRKMVLIK